MAGLKVGITIYSGANDTNAILWNSGINQNLVFLALLLQRLPVVSDVWLVNCPSSEEQHSLGALYGIPSISIPAAVDALDVLIELGARADRVSMERLRARGGRFVSYMAGNAMAMNFEAIASKVPHGEILSEVPFDAVWITPQHWRMNRSYCELTRSRNVHAVPHIWEPLCLQQALYRAGPKTAFWGQPPDAWRLGVFDPNINVLKTFHLPLLVCEEGYRRAPGLLSHVLLFCADHLKGNSHFEEFCAATDLARHKKVFVEPRYPLAQVIGTHVDAVVTHQWENELNYLYWDVLYLGRPLIHNSPVMKDVGGYYEPFDPQDGGRVLCEALRSHPQDTWKRQTAVQELLWGFSIDNPVVRARHAALLEQVMEECAA